MAVRNINEAKKLQKRAEKRPVKKVHIALAAAMILLFGTAIGTTAVNKARAADYKEQLQRVNSEAYSISAESAEIAETLKEENHDEYFEKVAREQYGYCKPGEKVYYDSAYGK
ncbi:MAG: septum formation initiator family protein [Clostridia bacterium]|nr:septum formation initiator family protein [Clostridia bacterium]MBR2418923.1 septum formation initiator family protein [Clostridia bacterium]